MSRMISQEEIDSLIAAAKLNTLPMVNLANDMRVNLNWLVSPVTPD
jgi:hypothetical protein